MDSAAILNKLVSHALTLGQFDRVNQHEPKNAPGNGLTYAIWAQSLAPIARGSGLAATSGRLEFNGRIYTSMLQQPEDDIDLDVLAATDKLLNTYSGDFELGGQVRDIDLLGEYGQPLQANAGYVSQDNKLLRVMTITIPLIVNDIWAQVA